MKAIGLFLCMAVASAQADHLLRPDFNQAPALQLSFGPYDVSAGDVNKDGHIDLLVAGNDVVVLLNQGDGTFDSPQVYLAGGSVLRLEVIDADSDGNLDIVALRLAQPGVTASVAILPGDGKGGFGPPAAYPCDSDSRYIAVGDFNRDGAPDIVAGASYTTNLAVLFNDGSGRFNRRSNINFGIGTHWATAANANADGNPDIIIADYFAGTVDIVLGNGDGTFQAPRELNVGPYPSLVAVADFDEDGRLDLGVFRSGVLDVLGGDGTGGFSRIGEIPISFEFAYLKVRVSDVNGDGHADLVYLTSRTVQILLGNGHGGFTAQGYTAGISPAGVAVADMNVDGRPDIAIADGLGDTLSLLLNKGDGSFAAPRVYEGIYKLVDLNGDKKLDAIGISRFRTNQVYARLGNGDGTFGEATIFTIDGNPGGGGAGGFSAVGDLNNDGHPDFVIALVGKKVGVLLGKDDGTLVSAPSHPVAAESLALGDFNDDGKLDLASAGWNTNAAISFGNGDGTFAPEMQIEGSGSGGPVVVGDFNNDGRLDLVVRLDVYLGNGNGTFTQAGSLPPFPWLGSVKVGDLNADGNLDLVAGSSRGELILYTGDGRGGFAELARGEGFSAVIADFNLDGKLDSALWLGYDARIVLGNGDGTFAPGPYIPQTGAVGDVNGDGWPDMVSGMVLLNQTFTRLAMTRTPSGMELGWPSFAAGLMLESTDNLLAPNWRRVPSRVSVQDNRYIVTNAVTGASEFYRLRRQ